MRLRDMTNTCGPYTCVTWLIDSNLWRVCLDSTKYVTRVTWLFIVGDVCSDDSFITMRDTTCLFIRVLWVTWHLTIRDVSSDYLFTHMSDMGDMYDIGAYTWQCVQWWLIRTCVWYGCGQSVMCVVVTHALRYAWHRTHSIICATEVLIVCDVCSDDSFMICRHGCLQLAMCVVRGEPCLISAKYARFIRNPSTPACTQTQTHTHTHTQVHTHIHTCKTQTKIKIWSFCAKNRNRTETLPPFRERERLSKRERKTEGRRGRGKREREGGIGGRGGWGRSWRKWERNRENQKTER